MNMKKSLIAAAVTGALAVPGAAMAQPTVYGKVNLGLQSANDDAAAFGTLGDPPGFGTGLFNADEAGEITMVEGASRLGFSGEEDLGNGLTAIYQYEFGVDPTQAAIATDDRVSYIGLTGDFGEVKAGRMWVGFYNHVGVTADLGDVIAAAPGYYTLSSSVSRVGDTVEYTGGTGGVEFTVGVVTSAETGNDKEDFDRLSISGSFDAGPVNVGVGHVANSNATGAEPSMTGFAVTGSAGNLGYGGSYVMEDLDNAAGQEPTALDAYLMSDFGGGVSGFVGVSQYDNDTDNDRGNLTSFWGHVDRALSSRTRLYAEFQSDSIDGGANPDTDPQQIVVGINHDF